MALSYEPKTPLGRFVNELEETVIASLLGIMTLITFTNVVLRYGFNTGLIWGLEMVTFLFAWLVLFGASYAVKVTAHLGVDVVVNLFGPRGRKAFALLGASVCIGFIPYAIMPLGMGLFLFRMVQATLRIYNGDSKSLIVSHEAEEAIEEVKHMNAGN